MKINEYNFISELKKGNHKALDYIYSKYINLVYKISLDILHSVVSKEDIEECVSDIFISVWKNISKYNPEVTSFINWLTAVSRYKSIDYLRKSKKQIKMLELNDVRSVSKDNIEDKLINNIEMSELYKLILNMTQPDRDIFIKRYILDEEICDIAKHLAVSRSSVDNRLSRGRKLLKTKWLKIIGR